jgi:hypothetical protein
VHRAVNEWLRQTDASDAIVDFDRGLGDPDIPPGCCRCRIAATTFTRAT